MVTPRVTIMGIDLNVSLCHKLNLSLAAFPKLRVLYSCVFVSTHNCDLVWFLVLAGGYLMS
jgi:hypothetical protein